MGNAWIRTEFGDKRSWSVKFQWIGWRRIISFGMVINTLAPALTLYLPCWIIRLGRLPFTTTHLIKIPSGTKTMVDTTDGPESA